MGYKRGIQNWENVWKYGIIPYHDNVNNRERNLIAERVERRKTENTKNAEREKRPFMPELEKEDKPKRSIDLSKISILLMFAAGLALMVLLGLLCVTDNVQIKRSRNDSGFSRIDDYSCREIRDADAPIGVRKEYTFFLSNTLESDTHLAFYTVHQYVDVFLDGETIYSLQPSRENRISKTVGSNWVMIPLYREDAGKEICVEITPVYESFRDREV